MPCSFHDLAREICTLLGAPVPELLPDESGLLAFSTACRGVDVSVTHDPVLHPDRIEILVFFGAPPQDKEVHVLRHLLDANLMMMTAAPRPSTYGRNPITGDIVFTSVCSLHQASGAALLEELQELTRAALQWRSEPPGGHDGPPGRRPALDLGSLA